MIALGLTRATGHALVGVLWLGRCLVGRWSLVVGLGAAAAPPAWLVHGWSCGVWGMGWLVLVHRRVGRWGGFALGWFSRME